ncbi:MAG: zinc finger domain-containing protein [Candidatus Aenigmatarchaeota archaeon]
MDRMRCNSCNTNVNTKSNFVIFSCPNCGESKIIRCNSCKALNIKYVCPKCGFVGP